MKITIDFDAATISQGAAEGTEVVPLDSARGFELAATAWLRAGWDAKHVYTFTWLGRPIIQLPEDMIRLQEVIYTVQPDVIIETGVAHGGSLIYYASLCKLLGRGRVIGVDIEIRPANRAAIEAHPLASYITLLEGSSTDSTIVASVSALVRPGECVLVLLDSNHSKAHVRGELDAYSPLVTPGSYIVAMDGIMAQVVGAPRTSPEWAWNNPISAVREFVADNPNFVVEEPAFAFNESPIRHAVTYWPEGYVRRLR